MSKLIYTKLGNLPFLMIFVSICKFSFINGSFMICILIIGIIDYTKIFIHVLSIVVFIFYFLLVQ